LLPKSNFTYVFSFRGAGICPKSCVQ
jgi:hypothetical protein